MERIEVCTLLRSVYEKKAHVLKLSKLYRDKSKEAPMFTYIYIKCGFIFF